MCSVDGCALLIHPLPDCLTCFNPRLAKPARKKSVCALRVVCVLVFGSVSVSVAVYIYIYMSVCVCLCICVCACARVRVCVLNQRDGYPRRSCK